MQLIDVSDIPDVLRDLRGVGTQYEIPELGDDITLYFNKDVNILTGKNNSGKTTVLEALSLWHECFTKLIIQAIRNQKKYKKEDWIFRLRSDIFSSFDQLQSSSKYYIEDIFYECQIKNKIKLGVTFQNAEGDILEIKFSISGLNYNYKIALDLRNI